MMNILAIKSTGDTTSMSVILQNEINTYSAKHERKDRPNWDTFLENIGLKKIFNLNEIDLFVYADSQNSYTATRTVASYLKGVAVALNKPLMVVKDISADDIKADSIAKIAKEQLKKENLSMEDFDPGDANPFYPKDSGFRKK